MHIPILSDVVNAVVGGTVNVLSAGVDVLSTVVNTTTSVINVFIK